MEQRAELRLRHRKIRDRSMVLLLLGLLLVLPPVAGIFHLDAKIRGVPLTLIYLFVVWALLIVGARWLAPRLGAEDGAGTTATRPETLD